MIRMQPDIQRNYFSGCYSKDKSNGGCGIRPPAQIITDGHLHIGSVILPIVDQHFASREILKQIMLQHDDIFRSQVHDLHRLYNRQRELMHEVNRSGLSNHHLRQEILQKNPFLSENSSNNPNKTCQASAFPWLNPATVQENYRQVGNRNIQTEVPMKESFELSETKFRKVGKKILDLELPADEYIESEEDESHVEVRVRSCDNSNLLVPENDNNEAPSLRKTEGLADLNEPVKLKYETDIDYNCLGGTISNFQVVAEELARIIQMDNGGANENSYGQSSSFLVDQGTGKSPCENHIPEGSESAISANGFARNVDVFFKQPSKQVMNMLSNESSKRRKCIHDPVGARIIVQALPCLSFSHKRRFGKGLNVNMNFKNASETGRGVEDSVDGKAKEVIDLNCSEDDCPCNDKSPGSGFAFDLNSCVNEVESSVASPLLAEITMEVRKSPEPEENQCGTSFLEEQTRIAANAIVSISLGSNAFCKPVESSRCNSLRWLSRIASSVVDDPESELGIGLSWKEADFCDGYFSDVIDYFEAMTLKLKDSNFEDHYCLIAHTEEYRICQDSSPSLPSRARTRRVKQQRQDFQSEILPGLASFSRQEVSKDLWATSGLIDQRDNKNRHVRGRTRRSRNSASSSSQVDKESESSLQLTSLIGLGKITRRRRGPRCPATNPRFVLGQA